MTVKRPGTGISPMRWDEVIGQVAQKDYKKDELVKNFHRFNRLKHSTVNPKAWPHKPTF
ncbi:hypothetical protein [Desulfosarcina sp. BuS5]|uniref:hypothetical protein n=1 Tax=Desulfosarcina sp. BuS5 TaxID=933262 RepID=UPI0023792A58|nr:hypothetical protein [Desulfosarcina sp. BuS5]